LFRSRIARQFAAFTTLVAVLATAVAADGVSSDVAGEGASGGATRVSYRPDPSPLTLPTAERLVLHKGERRLELLRKGEVLRSYKVALGLQPVGHKERSGDFRTPEGKYQLTRRNPRSDFFLSIQISYPSDQDARYARSNGWDPGGSIMIHGLPNVLKRDPTYYQTRDWTDGCIAVSNADMVEIWLLTHDNTPIEILP
jgi:murein L,D-transpeptidase YafK